MCLTSVQRCVALYRPTAKARTGPSGPRDSRADSVPPTIGGGTTRVAAEAVATSRSYNPPACHGPVIAKVIPGFRTFANSHLPSGL